MGIAPTYAILCKIPGTLKYKTLEIGRGDRMRRYARYRTYLESGLPVRWVTITGYTKTHVSSHESGSSIWHPKTQNRS